MSSVNYYSALMNQGGGLNANYLAYKSRVEADGGAVVNETITNSKFAFLDSNSILSDLAFLIDKDGGNKISSNLVQKAYSFDSGNYDFTAASGQEPTDTYDFNATAILENTTSKALNTTDITVVFKTGSQATDRFDFILGDNIGTGGAGAPRIGLRFGEDPNNVLIIYTRNSGQSALTAYFSSIDFALNKTWMVVIRPFSSHLIYVDGVLQETITSTQSSNIAGIEDQMNIGGWGNGPDYSGDLPLIGIFNGDKSSLASAIYSNL